MGESAPALPEPLPPGWLSDGAGVPGAADELVVRAEKVLTVVREMALREMGEMARREVGGREVGGREADTGKRPASRVSRGRRLRRSARTTRRVTASKRGLQVVRVSSGVCVGSRTAISEGGTTHWCTTS